jgi:hypothetical protein
VTELHGIVGVAVIAANALAGAWGGIAWLRHSPSVGFWYLLRAAQATVVVQAVLGLALTLGNRAPPDGLHVLYGLAPLVVTLVTEAMRVGAAQREFGDAAEVDELERTEQVLLARRVVRREMGIMTVGALLIVTLALRAAFTSA